jgi:hypothetical protein
MPAALSVPLPPDEPLDGVEPPEPVVAAVSELSSELRLLPPVLLVVVIALPCPFLDVVPPWRKCSSPRQNLHA